MGAKDYLDLPKDEAAILRLVHYAGNQCDGRGAYADRFQRGSIH